MTGKLNSEEFVRLWNKVNSYKVTIYNCQFKHQHFLQLVLAHYLIILFFFFSTRKFSSSLTLLGLARCR